MQSGNDTNGYNLAGKTLMTINQYYQLDFVKIEFIGISYSKWASELWL